MVYKLAAMVVPAQNILLSAKRASTPQSRLPDIMLDISLSFNRTHPQPRKECDLLNLQARSSQRGGRVQ